MKQKILLLSLSASGVATLLGLIAVFKHINLDNSDAAVNSLTTIYRLYQLAGIAGLFGISSFFVGLAYPVDKVVDTHTSFDGEGKKFTETRSVRSN